jgi:hypothetical protein
MRHVIIGARHNHGHRVLRSHYECDSGFESVFFVTLKKTKQTATRVFDEASTREYVTRLLQAHEQTATSTTIRESFQRAGLCPDTGTKSFKLRFDKEKLKDNLGF